MTNLREAALMALDALSMAVEPKKGKVYAFDFQPIDCAAMHLKAIEALRAALAQPEQEPVWGDSQVTKPEIVAEQKAMNEGLRKMVEQEPVAWWHDRGDVVDLNVSGHGKPLYFAPPQRDWQGLTDMEISKIYDDCNDWEHYEYERMIEAKLKEKNA